MDGADETKTVLRTAWERWVGIPGMMLMIWSTLLMGILEIVVGLPWGIVLFVRKLHEHFGDVNVGGFLLFVLAIWMVVFGVGAWMTVVGLAMTGRKRTEGKDG